MREREGEEETRKMLNDHGNIPAPRGAAGPGGYTLGVLGGLGPLASAEFLKTIYEQNRGEYEQSLPRVVLYSDPTFPDRTDALLRGLRTELLERLTAALGVLLAAGASEVAICCITIHHLLPELPRELRERVISLVDVIFAEVARQRRRHLLLCTYGSRKLGIFESHGGWPAAEEFVVLPDEADQQSIHAMIYSVKRGDSIESLLPALGALLSKYGADSFIAGCTEIHLLSKRAGYDCIDPLLTIAHGLYGAGEERAEAARPTTSARDERTT
jgi:aspartate racemase